MLLEKTHLVVGLAPVADAFSATVRSDVVNISKYQKVRFIVFWGVGATGTTTITVEASDDVVPTNVTAIPFYYRRYTSPDTEGAVTAATSAGFATTAGSNQVYAIEVDAQSLASTGYNYVSLKAVEVTDSPILGGILIELAEPRYGQTAVESVVV